MEFIPKNAPGHTPQQVAAAQTVQLSLREIGVAAVAAALGMAEDVASPLAAETAARAEQDSYPQLSKKAA